MWMPPPALGNEGPKLIHQSPIQTMFIQLCLTSQLFTLTDESSNKKDGKDCRAIARHGTQKKNRFSLHRALVFAFGEVGDCLGFPLGEINYTSFFKRALFGLHRNARSKQAPEVPSIIPFYVFTSNFLFLLKLFPYSLLKWKCGAFEMLLPNFNCPPFFLPRMTNVFPVQKHMLLFEKPWCKLLSAVALFVVAGGAGRGDMNKNYFLFHLRVFLAASLCVLELKRNEKD